MICYSKCCGLRLVQEAQFAQETYRFTVPRMSEEVVVHLAVGKHCLLCIGCAQDGFGYMTLPEILDTMNDSPKFRITFMNARKNKKEELISVWGQQSVDQTKGYFVHTTLSLDSGWISIGRLPESAR